MRSLLTAVAVSSVLAGWSSVAPKMSPPAMSRISADCLLLVSDVCRAYQVILSDQEVLASFIRRQVLPLNSARRLTPDS